MSTFIEEEKKKLEGFNNSTISSLYSIEQMLNIFKDDFKKEYNEFMNRVEELRKKYYTLLEESKKKLTFIVDPNIDSAMLGEVLMLEEEVRDFTLIKYKVEVFLKSLEAFIVRLNILYNVTVKYDSDDDKRKLSDKLDKIYELQEEMYKELEEYDSLLKKEKKHIKACEYIAYIEYTILKLKVRLDDTSIQYDEIKDEYINVFKDFILDEVSDLKDLLEKVSTPTIRQAYSYNLSRIINSIVNSDDISKLIRSEDIWLSLIENETNSFEILRLEKVNEDLLKVKILDRLEVKAKEEDFLIPPVTISRIELCELYAKYGDKKILFTIKFIEKLNTKVTYKELYFVFILFDVYQYIQSTNKKLARVLKKYESKYSYSDHDITKKKELVKELDSKEFMDIFEEDENTNLVKTLENLNLDFYIDNNKVFLNTFYFKDLENIENSFNDKTIKSN